MSDKLKIVLIDDEIATRIICRSYLQDIENISIVGEASNIDEAKLLIDATQPNLILLDIQLGNKTGFDLLQLFENPTFKVIFITAYEQYALAAIKAGALDYLLKPIVEEDLIAAIKKSNFTNAIQSQAIEVAKHSLENKWVERITLSGNDGLHIVWTKDIVYCSSSGNYTTFHLANNKQIVISKVLKEYDTILASSHFLRVHQSFLVNMNFVERFTKDQNLIMQNGAEIMVASRKKDEVIHWMKKYL